jgi:rare lipoprotein A
MRAIITSVAIAVCVTTARAETGIASIYGGGRTASGEYASASGLTAAHKTIPLGSHVRVTNNRNGRSIAVRINDRDPLCVGVF